MIEAIVIGLGAIWFFYKWITQKEMKYILISLVLIVFQLSRWPFFLNANLVFGVISIISAVLMGIEFFVKKRIGSIYPYIIIQLAIGGLLISQVFFPLIPK